MRKIPTLYLRDENDRRYVTREVNPEAAWVLDGEARATRLDAAPPAETGSGEA